MYLKVNKNNEIHFKGDPPIILFVRNNLIRKKRINQQLYRVLMFPVKQATLYKNFMGKYIIKNSPKTHLILLKNNQKIKNSNTEIFKKVRGKYVTLYVIKKTDVVTVEDEKKDKIFQIIFENFNQKITTPSWRTGFPTLRRM